MVRVSEAIDADIETLQSNNFTNHFVRTKTIELLVLRALPSVGKGYIRV